MLFSRKSNISADANWWRQAAIYQIYPRSFKDSNGDGIGDIRGIISKIDYLESLSIDAVWLSPFYPSALADGGYDVDDYRNVDPKLGTLRDFDEMVKKLHDRGIRIFVDIVPNHSSNRHQWFQDALRSAPGSRERDRYIFRDGKGKNGELPPSNWPSHFAPSAWTRTKNPNGSWGQWYCHLFAPEQPDFNWDNREVQEDFIKTLRFWADRGVDGFRIDVAHALKKDLSEPLRSMPKFTSFKEPLTGDGVLFDRNEVHDIYREWRRVFNEYNPPRVAVAEAYVRVERRMLYARPDELGQAFNFDLLGAPFDAKLFRKYITNGIKWAKKEGSSSTWVLNNHDKIRSATRYGLPKNVDIEKWLHSNGKKGKLDREVGIDRSNAAMLMLLALPGCTYIYQGEELGLHEVENIPEDQIQDPQYLRNHKKFKGRDGCRVPLPWVASGEEAGQSFGFGSAGAHLPQPKWFKKYAVDAQEGEDGTLDLYRAALLIRKSMQCEEELKWIKTTSAQVLHFSRPNGWQSITNFNAAPYKLPAGELMLTSKPLIRGRLPKNATAWVLVK